MVTTVVATNNIATGNRISFTAAGENYAILTGVTVASIDADAIFSNFGDNKLRIDGTVLAEGTAVFMSGGGNEITIGAQGRVVSNVVGDSGAAIGLGSEGGSVLTNYGEISSPGRIAILAPRADILNHGNVDGVSPMFLGAFGRAGATLTNTGIIAAVGQGDETGSRYNNAVYFEGDNGLLTNTGTISASFAGGAAVRFGGGEGTGGGGGRVLNSGEIISLAGVGVNAAEASTGSGVTVVNSGLITGGTSAIVGSAESDSVSNIGAIFGNVSLANGNDRYFGSGDGQVTGVIRGGGGSDTLVGGDGDDNMDGGKGVDLLRGGRGNDALQGAEGADVLRGGEGDDALVGAGGRDILSGGADDDTLNGGNGKDTLRGGAGDDSLQGGAEADLLDGGRGNDILFGGDGADVFVFEQGSGLDRVTDFTDGADRVNMVAFGLSGFGDLTSTFTVEGIAGGVRIDTGSDILILEGAVFADLNGADFLF